MPHSGNETILPRIRNSDESDLKSAAAAGEYFTFVKYYLNG